MHGVAEYVVVSGRVCVDECNLKVVHGFGKYLETPLYPLYVYDEVNEKEKVRKHHQMCASLTLD